MLVIGHRGAAGVAPENTWVSFDAALALGVDAIETDVRATSDGELILFHDRRLERTTNGAGLVKRTSWKDIEGLDAGSWFDAKLKDVRVPTLKATLERYGNLTHFVLEIKKRGIESLVAALVRRLEMADRVTFTSFHFDTVLAIKRELPQCKVGFLVSDSAHANAIRTLDAGIGQFCPRAGDITSACVRQWKKLGLEVRAWGVPDRETAIAVREMGIDGITIDQPEWLR